MTKANDALSAFLSADLNVTDSVFLKRLNVNIEIKAIDGKTIAAIQEQATHGKTLDESKFNALIIATACTNVPFGDSQMLAKYGASDPGDCVQKALLAGEMARLTKKILEISGFDEIDDLVNEAKN